MSTTASAPTTGSTIATPRKGDHIKRVAIVFSGGPAPAANAVISSSAISFLEDDRQVIGFFHGYSNLEGYHPVTHRLLPDEHRVHQVLEVVGRGDAERAFRSVRAPLRALTRSSRSRAAWKPATVSSSAVPRGFS